MRRWRTTAILSGDFRDVQAGGRPAAAVRESAIAGHQDAGRGVDEADRAQQGEPVQFIVANETFTTYAENQPADHQDRGQGRGEVQEDPDQERSGERVTDAQQTREQRPCQGRGKREGEVTIDWVVQLKDLFQ